MAAFWLKAVAVVIIAFLVYPYLGGGPPRTIEPANPECHPSLPEGVSRRVLVVGGGVAGLTAALELAERGFDVTVKEQRAALGGKYSTETFEASGEEFQLSTAFHAFFYNNHNLKRIIKRLDLDKFYISWPDNHIAFREYEWENMYSSGPWPLNLLGIILRSPNLSLWTAMQNWRVSLDFVLFNHGTVYEEYDHLTYAEWADLTGVVPAFGDIWLKPAISASFNNITKFSAAELLVNSHFFFLSGSMAEKRQYSTEDSGTSLITPWVKRLEELGVKFILGNPVTALGVDPASGKVSHDVADPTVTYDHVILAVDLGSTKMIISQSVKSLPESHKGRSGLGELDRTLQHLPLAQPSKTLKIWFDKRLSVDQKYQVLQTPQHRPVNMIAQLHLIKNQYRRWAEKSDGSIMEFHLYSWYHGDVTKERMWEIISPAVFDVFPEMAERNFKVLASHLATVNNIASFDNGTAKYRPQSTYPAVIGVPNLSLAGDWLRTDYPSALTERAVCTGMEAANHILSSEGVRQVPLVVTTQQGPGLI